MATVAAPHESVETLRRVLSYLVTERQQLRFHAGSPSELEANRLAIVAMQWQLSRALAERHGSSAMVSSRF